MNACALKRGSFIAGVVDGLPGSANGGSIDLPATESGFTLELTTSNTKQDESYDYVDQNGDVRRYGSFGDFQQHHRETYSGFEYDNSAQGVSLGTFSNSASGVENSTAGTFRETPEGVCVPRTAVSHTARRFKGRFQSVAGRML